MPYKSKAFAMPPKYCFLPYIHFKAHAFFTRHMLGSESHSNCITYKEEIILAKKEAGKC